MPNNSTKLALEASLKNLLLKKPVDKITITDLTNDCGITRMAFYYHFKDIYDLVEWSCYDDASKDLHGKKTNENVIRFFCSNFVLHAGRLFIYDEQYFR